MESETWDIKVWLRNRNPEERGWYPKNMMRKFREKYQVKDQNLIPLDRLKIRELKPELLLRGLSTNGRKAELIKRLKSYEPPSIEPMPTADKPLVHAYLCQNEIVLQMSYLFHII